MKEVFLLVRPWYGVNIHTDAQGEYGTVLHSNDVFPDLPLLYAATMLDQSDDYDVLYIDAYTNRILPDELLRRIKEASFDKIIVKTTAASIKSDIELIRQIKANDPDSYVMTAGHAAKDLKSWIDANTDIDEVIEEPLDKFIYRYVHGEDGTVNDLPTPDYSLVDYKRYTDDLGRVRLTVQASRGCPMNCAYCPYIRFYDKYEPRDVDHIMEDVRSLASLGAEVIQFRDQFFTCDRKKVRELCSRMIEENIKVSWICETKLDSLDEEMIDIMKQAGLFMVCFGIESGDQTMMDSYNSNKGSLAKQQATVALLRSKGILTMAFYIIGFPEDTWDSVRDTYDYANKIASDIVAFNEYTLFPFERDEEFTPDVFFPFANATNVPVESNLTREEIRYVIDLFSAMYTADHDCLEKAYTFNHLISAQYKKTVALLAGCGNDLQKMSDAIRQMQR